MKYLKNYKYYICRGLDKLGLIRRLTFDLTVRLGARTFTIPVKGPVGYLNLLPVTEPWMTELIERATRAREGVVVDVGMNVGQTILKLELYGHHTGYIGFEPNPICYAYCKELVEKNGLERYSLFPVGLSNHAEVVTLFGDNAHTSKASILGEFRDNKGRFVPIHRVPVMPGDELMRKEGVTDIALMKLDIEGAELEALQGLSETLQRTRPPVIVEILPVYNLEKEHLRERKRRQDELLAFMKGLNYQAFLILEAANRIRPLDAIPVHGDMSRTNYVFLEDGSRPFFEDLIDSQG